METANPQNLAYQALQVGKYAQAQVDAINARRCACNTRLSSDITAQTDDVIPLTITAQVGAKFSISNGALVCPLDGYVHISAGMMVSDDAAGKYIGVSIKKNDITIIDAYSGYTLNYGCLNTRNIVEQVSAGDKLTLHYRGSDAALLSSSNRTGIALHYI